MLKVGVIGLGMMGLTHLGVYGKRDDVKVLAISDKMPDRLEGRTRAKGNVEGQAQGTVDFASVRKYPEGLDLINDPEIQVVDVCLPTPMHLEYALAALKAGKHVFVEKPVARTAEQAQQLQIAAEKAASKNQVCMVGMCLRFWPGWTWLRSAIREKTYGDVLSAHFRRVASHPGGAFYRDGAACGGALLDLHIHDTDFVQFCFGPPRAVQSCGYTCISGEIDHVITRYVYDDIPMVMAEGSWAMADGFPFTMQYTVNFEHATAVYDMGAAEPLVLYHAGQRNVIAVDPIMGYDHELAYFIECIKANRQPEIVTMKDATNCVRILEAERLSIHTAKPVGVNTL